MRKNVIPVKFNSGMGKIEAKFKSFDVTGKSAYKYAQDGGYTGTEEEFAHLLASLGNMVMVKDREVFLPASAWTKVSDVRWEQIVKVDGVTERSRVNIRPNSVQVEFWYDKSLALVAEQEDGIVYIYAIGDRPTKDYTIQVEITEVAV